MLKTFNEMKVQNLWIFALAIGSLTAGARTPVRYGTGLPASGSDKAAHTIFTNPGEDCSTSMNISWASPAGAVAKVVYSNGTDSASVTSRGRLCNTFDSINSKLGDNTDVFERHVFDHHTVSLSGLKPDTRYSYRIITTVGDSTTTSDAYTFRTAGADSWKAAVIGDFHHYSPLWRRLDAATSMIDVLDSVSGGFDWILSPGDQCAWGGSYNYWTELAEQPAYKGYMWGAVQGNHDHMSRDKINTDAYFRDSHANPTNGYEGQEGISYWFRYGDVLFIMLNNEAMRTAASLEPVIAWMDRVVADNPSKYIVVVEHYEWLIGTNGANSQLDRFRDAFDRLGVDLAISGNNHVYLRTAPLLDRTVVEPGRGTQYVVTPSSDDSRGRDIKPLEANDDIIVTRWSEGPHTVGAMIMDVNPERILMTLYDRKGAVADTFTVPARR